MSNEIALDAALDAIGPWRFTTKYKGGIAPELWDFPADGTGPYYLYVMRRKDDPTREVLYAGQTGDFEKRVAQHLSGKGGAPVVEKAVAKYGAEAFTFDIVETHDSADAIGAAEVNCITFGWMSSACRYNISPGGSRGDILAAVAARALLPREVSSEVARKGRETLGPEGCSEAARKSRETLGPEGCSEAMRKANETRGPERRSAASRKAKETLGPEGRSEVARKGRETMGAEARSRAARIGHETRAIKSGRLDVDGLPWLPGQGPNAKPSATIHQISDYRHAA
jgi:predicted GIY-YIG superfamily endonuclease